LPIIWWEKRLVVLHRNLSKDIKRDGKVVAEGNYDGSSRGMEGDGLRWVLDQLQELGILQYCKNIVMDKDSSTTAIVKAHPHCTHIETRIDPGLLTTPRIESYGLFITPVVRVI
jgi:hypothetical protein